MNSMNIPEIVPEPASSATKAVDCAPAGTEGTGTFELCTPATLGPEGIAPTEALTTDPEMSTPAASEETTLAKRESLPLTRALAAVVTLIVASFGALLTATLLIDPHIAPTISLGLGSPLLGMIAGLVFWTLLTALAEASPVEMPRGIKASPAIIPCLAAAFLGGPLAGALVAFVGLTEKRELTGEVSWYGVLTNHASSAGSVMLAGLIYAHFHQATSSFLPLDLGIAFLAGFVGVTANILASALIVTHRLGRSFRGVLKSDMADAYLAFCMMVPFAWLFMFLYSTAGFWASLLAAAPLYTMRTANQRFMEMRETFVQAIRALAHALDARDIYTAGHSHRMSEVAVDIAHVLNLSDDDTEQLEWAGILHDVGKIGVPDRVLLKQGKLDDEERDLIEAHPVIGALIVAPVTRLSPEVPLIRHHHERWDGRGYPDGLAGEDIPLMARILAVADSFEAMTAQRPYRMIPLTAEEAYAEIMKCSGSQFDPAIVEAFGQTKWARGEYDRTRGNIDPRFADVSMVSGSARHVDEVKTAADRRTLADRRSGGERRVRVVEFVDPHGDEARAKEVAAAAALSAQALAAAEVAVRHGHGHPHDPHLQPKARAKMVQD